MTQKQLGFTMCHFFCLNKFEFIFYWRNVYISKIYYKIVSVNKA